jgi:hypothetical protein
MRLSVQQLELVLPAIKHRLPKVLYGTYDLVRFIKLLGEEKGMVVLNTLKDDLPSVIANSNPYGHWGDKGSVFFFPLLEGLTENMIRFLCEAVEEKKLLHQFTCADDFLTGLQSLNETQGMLVIDILKDSLPSIFSSQQALFTWRLKQLPDRPRHALIEAMIHRIPDMVESDADVSNLLEFISSENNPAVFLEVIKNMRAWQNLGIFLVMF